MTWSVQYSDNFFFFERGIFIAARSNAVIYTDRKTICDAIKQNESEVERNQMLFFGICYLRII